MLTARVVRRLLMLALLAACGCERHARDRAADRRGSSPVPLAVRVFADTGRAERLPVRPPRVRVWLDRVRPSAPARLDPGVPPPPSDTLWPGEPAGAPGLAIDPDLKPPILRTPAALRLAATRRSRTASVELDVRVDDEGTVSDALWAGGDADSALVAAAVESALGMRFYPALRDGRPVAVWCRQRFEFAPPGR